MADKTEKQLELQIKQTELQIKQAENTQVLIQKGIPAIENYFNTKMDKIEHPKIKWITIIFGVVLAIIVIGSGILVYEGKIDSDNFTFLLGIIIGYLMTFIGDIYMGGE